MPKILVRICFSLIASFVIVGGFVFGLSEEVADSFALNEPEVAQKASIVDDGKTSDGNINARIPVLEYHNIAETEGRWARSIENFRSDLEFLRNNDYHLITVRNFMSGDFDVPAGKKPVLMTFDDGLLNQFEILDDGSIDPNSAVGMMEDFCLKYADFNCTAIFYLNTNSFRQKDKIKEKLDFLLKNGYEIGNHTLTHADLGKSGNIKREIGGLNNYLLERMQRCVLIDSVAYPFGAYPKTQAGIEQMASGEYDGGPYIISSGFLVGAEPAYSPTNPKFDPYKIPRIQAIDDEWLRHFNRPKGFTGKVRENFVPYVLGGGELSEGSELTDELEINKLPGETEVVDFAASGDYSFKKNIWGKIEFNSEKIVVPAESIYNGMADYVKPMVNRITIKELPDDLELKGDKYYYLVKDEDTAEKIAARFRRITDSYTDDELILRMKEVNDGVDFEKLEMGQEIIIPGVQLMEIERPVPKDLRGIYLTAYSVKGKGRDYADKLAAEGGNMIVFDVKAGRVGYKSGVAAVLELGDDSRYAYDLEEYVGYLHSKNIYAVGRFVVFKDAHLAAVKPEWTLKNKVSGKSWANNEGAVWLDPSNPDYHDYIIALCVEMAQMGIDEIQFDYVRFPALGNTASMTYLAEKDGKTRDQVITDFVRKVKVALAGYNVKIGVDVFGIVGWSDLDARIVGQKIPELSKVVDVIYPMVYPSHFGKGYHGHADPGMEPYYFVQESMKKFQVLVDEAGSEGADVEIRPWFQGFPLGVKGFGSWYMEAQKKAINDIGVDSFVIWSPGNYYSVSWGIMGGVE